MLPPTPTPSPSPSPLKSPGGKSSRPRPPLAKYVSSAGDLLKQLIRLLALVLFLYNMFQLQGALTGNGFQFMRTLGAFLALLFYGFIYCLCEGHVLNYYYND